MIMGHYASVNCAIEIRKITKVISKCDNICRYVIRNVACLTHII